MKRPIPTENRRMTPGDALHCILEDAPAYLREYFFALNNLCGGDDAALRAALETPAGRILYADYLLRTTLMMVRGQGRVTLIVCHPDRWTEVAAIAPMVLQSLGLPDCAVSSSCGVEPETFGLGLAKEEDRRAKR